MNQLVTICATNSTPEAGKEYKLKVFKVSFRLIIEEFILGAQITHHNEAPDPLENAEEGERV